MRTLPSHQGSFGRCPGCGIVAATISDPVTSVRFPDDISNIQKILEGTLNSTLHGCGTYFYADVEILVEWPELRRQVRMCSTDQAVGPLNDRSEVVAGYGTLRESVGKWISDLTNSTFRALARNDFLSQSIRERIESIPAVVLIGLALEIRGRTASDLSIERPPRPDVYMSTLDLIDVYTRLVADQLNRVVMDQATSVAGDGYLIARAAKVVPRVAVNGYVLERMLEGVEAQVQKGGGAALSPDSLPRIFTAELCCGIAHVIAEKPNPRAPLLAQLLVFTWDLMTHVGDAPPSEQIPIDVGSLRELATFEQVADACSSFFIKDHRAHPSQIVEMLGRSHDLMQFLGYEAKFNEWATLYYVRMARTAELGSIDTLVKALLTFPWVPVHDR